jgi:pimeloyl-ACP methyl ester carboxylesterase
MTQTVLTDDGVPIEYKVYGTGPLTLLFLHGWGNAANSWDDLLASRLNLSGLRCIAASYRGHGASQPAPSGYTQERFARDMFEVADTVRADRFVIVGFSMAGNFGRYMTHLHPDRVMGQVLIAAPGPQILAAPREAFTPWLDAAPYPERFREILLTFIKRPIPDPLLDLYCQNVATASRAALDGTLDMFYVSTEMEVRNIRTPTLIICGEFDPLFNREYTNNFLVPTVARARTVFVPCGHEIPFEMPDETANLIEAFLAGLHY